MFGIEAKTQRAKVSKPHEPLLVTVCFFTDWMSYTDRYSGTPAGRSKTGLCPATGMHVPRS